MNHQVLVSSGGRSISLVNIYVWDGNYYALAITEQLGLEESDGMVRVGPVHYNTVEEIKRFGEALACIIRGLLVPIRRDRQYHSFRISDPSW